METKLIEHAEKMLKNDPTGQERRYFICKLEASKAAYENAAHILEGQVKNLLARAREADVFIELLKRGEDG